MEASFVKFCNLVELARQNLPFGGWELVFVGIFFFYRQIFRLIRSAIFFGIVIALVGGVLLKNTDFLDAAKNQLLEFVKEKSQIWIPHQVRDDKSRTNT